MIFSNITVSNNTEKKNTAERPQIWQGITRNTRWCMEAIEDKVLISMPTIKQLLYKIYIYPAKVDCSGYLSVGWARTPFQESVLLTQQPPHEQKEQLSPAEYMRSSCEEQVFFTLFVIYQQEKLFLSGINTHSLSIHISMYVPGKDGSILFIKDPASLNLDRARKYCRIRHASCLQLSK